MDENMIRVLVASARDLLKFFSTCTTEQDFDTFFDRMTDVAVRASEAIQRITNTNMHEAAEIFIGMVNDDTKRETFIAQAFIAQPAAVVAIGA